MTPIKYGKLVRDNIPDIILADGYVPVVDYLHGEPYGQALRAKLVEEAGEFVGSENVSELVDIYEVVITLAAELGYTCSEFMQSVEAKREERGGLRNGAYLRLIEVPK